MGIHGCASRCDIWQPTPDVWCTWHHTPCSQTFRSHSMHETGYAPALGFSRRRHSHACDCTHLREWHTNASQKSLLCVCMCVWWGVPGTLVASRAAERRNDIPDCTLHCDKCEIDQHVSASPHTTRATEHVPQGSCLLRAVWGAAPNSRLQHTLCVHTATHSHAATRMQLSTRHAAQPSAPAYLRAHGQPLHGVAEVTERPGLLPFVALVTHHVHLHRAMDGLLDVADNTRLPAASRTRQRPWASRTLHGNLERSCCAPARVPARMAFCTSFCRSFFLRAPVWHTRQHTRHPPPPPPRNAHPT